MGELSKNIDNGERFGSAILKNLKLEFNFHLHNLLADGIRDTIKTIDEDGYIFRAILVLLPKGKSIPKHIDTGESLTIPRRIHIAVQTNPNCFFNVGDVTKNLKEGEIWEIDNSGQRHAVSNEGDTDRIHLIVDFLKK